MPRLEWDLFPELEKCSLAGYKKRVQTTAQQIREEAAACDDVKVAQARRMSASEKFLAGADLFEEACRWTLLGIRNQFPDYSTEEQRAELRRRLKMI